LGGLDPGHPNVVELQAYTSFDEVCMLARKLEQQKKARQSFKPQTSKPSTHEQTVNKGSSFSTPKATVSIPPIRQKNKTPQQSLLIFLQVYGFSP